MKWPFFRMAKTVHIQATLGLEKLWAKRAREWSATVAMNLLILPQRHGILGKVAAAGLNTCFKIGANFMTSHVSFEARFVPGEVGASREHAWKRCFFVVGAFICSQNILGFNVMDIFAMLRYHAFSISYVTAVHTLKGSFPRVAKTVQVKVSLGLKKLGAKGTSKRSFTVVNFLMLLEGLQIFGKVIATGLRAYLDTSLMTYRVGS